MPAKDPYPEIGQMSATRGERSAADRLRELLSTAFGSDWSAAAV